MPESNLEDKFKLTLLQIEKRFVDLEMGLSEIKEKLKEVSPDQFSSMNQRMDDIEDLSMVEDAAVTEFKQMLVDLGKKFDSVPSAMSEIQKLQERIAAIEKEISEVSLKPAGMEVEERVKKLEADISSLQVRKPQSPPEMEEYQKRIAEMSQRLTSLKMEYEETVKTIEARMRSIASSVSGVPVADLDFIDQRLESVRTAVDMMSDKKVETDLKLAGVEEKILLLDQKIREAISQKFVDEIKAHKRDIMATNIRTESVERVVKELTAEMQQVENNVKRFEGFEKLTLLNKQVEEKLERFKFIEDQTSRLSTRIETIYDDMNKNFSGFKNVERRVDGIVQNNNNMIRDLEKAKMDIQQVARRGELQDFNKKFETKYIELERKLREAQSRPVEVGDKGVNDLRSSLNQTIKVVTEIEDKVNRLNREVPAIFVEKSEIKNVVYGMRDRVNSLEGRMRDVNQVVGNANPESLQRLGDSLNKVDELSKRLTSLEERMEEMKITTPDIAEMIPQSGYVDEQISELLGKLVFLESRISAIEQSVTERPAMQPIILE